MKGHVHLSWRDALRGCGDVCIGEASLREEIAENVFRFIHALLLESRVCREADLHGIEALECFLRGNTAQSVEPNRVDRADAFPLIERRDRLAGWAHQTTLGVHLHEGLQG